MIDQRVRLFGPAAQVVLNVLAASKRLSGFEYQFMDVTEFQTLIGQNLSAAMKVYWQEMLFRAHFAAATSLLRTARWLDAVLVAGAANNFFGFAASFRGLLEAAADSHDSLADTVVNLADAHVVIRRALEGSLDRMTVHPYLEEKLIHFTHARRVEKHEPPLPGHRAKATAEYLRALDVAGGPQVMECYGELCEVTHPAAPSVFAYTAYSQTGKTGRYSIGPIIDDELIDTFCRKHVGLMLPVIVLGVGPAVFQFRVLAEFRDSDLPIVDVSDFPSDIIWAQLKARLDDPSAPGAK